MLLADERDLRQVPSQQEFLPGHSTWRILESYQASAGRSRHSVLEQRALSLLQPFWREGFTCLASLDKQGLLYGR